MAVAVRLGGSRCASRLPDLDPRAERVLAGLLPGPVHVRRSHRGAEALPRGDCGFAGGARPDHPPLLALLASLGTAIAASSANSSGHPAPATLEEVDPGLLARCAVAFGAAPGGPTVGGIASTVVDLRPLARGGPATVAREGAVTAVEALARVAAVSGG